MGHSHTISGGASSCASRFFCLFSVLYSLFSVIYSLLSILLSLFPFPYLCRQQHFFYSRGGKGFPPFSSEKSPGRKPVSYSQNLIAYGFFYYCVRIFFYREEKKFNRVEPKSNRAEVKSNRAETDHFFAIIFFLIAIKKIFFAENSSILAKIFLKPTFPGFMSTLNILK